MNAKTSTNGQARKSLADQIDRLDGMLDGLNEAVADAVREAVGVAVQEAVRVVLSETLTNPAVLARLHAAAQPEQPPASPPAKIEPPPPKTGFGGQLASCRHWLGQRLKNGGTQVRTRCQRLCAAVKVGAGRVVGTGALALAVVTERVTQAGACVRPLWRRKFQILAALVLGLALGAAGFFAGPYLSVVAGVACGFVVTLTVQAILWRRRLLALDELRLDPPAGFGE